MAEIVCPRCGHKNSFMKGYLPDTCVCRVCQSQLDWREIPGAGPDCCAAPQRGTDQAKCAEEAEEPAPPGASCLDADTSQPRTQCPGTTSN